MSAVLFVLRQKGSDGALVPLAMFRNRVFSASLGIAAAMTFGMYAMLFLTPLYLQAGRGDGALLAAVELLPMSVTFAIVSVAVAVASVPTARSGTASGLVNTARMVGATLGVAVLGALFAMFAGGSGSGHVAAGLPAAFIVGGIGEMLGAVAAFKFIDRDSLG